MNDPPDMSREQRRDFRFKRRYVLGNLFYAVPALIAFGSHGNTQRRAGPFSGSRPGRFSPASCLEWCLTGFGFVPIAARRAVGRSTGRRSSQSVSARRGITTVPPATSSGTRASARPAIEPHSRHRIHFCDWKRSCIPVR